LTVKTVPSSLVNQPHERRVGMTKSSAKTALSPAKRDQILRGACTLFRELGYERTSVDAIASTTGVSKATIYNHFRDKKALFLAIVETENEEARGRFLALLETPSGDLEADLRRIGEQLLLLIGTPGSVHRYRIVTAEVDRFPELSRSLYECNILEGQRRMTLYFERAAAMGLLTAGDPAEAALDFAALCAYQVSLLLHLGIAEASPALIAPHVDRAVRTFLRAYRPA